MRNLAKIFVILVVMFSFCLRGLSAFEQWNNLSPEEARTIVKLLDDVYKYYIVFDTINHVDNPDRVSAATLTKQVFKEMEKKGWHSARLVSATDKALNKENMPKDEFEKDAVKALREGQAFYEKTEVIEGKRVYRAATPVPVVLKECKMCHPYLKDDEIMGALAYTLPLGQ
ncbi:MAG TPA: c-type heme family protein [Candidatus Hypogeohydataceae bacterium YC41]